MEESDAENRNGLETELRAVEAGPKFSIVKLLRPRLGSRNVFRAVTVIRIHSIYSFRASFIS